jgi:hypothetical protein
MSQITATPADETQKTPAKPVPALLQPKAPTPPVPAAVTPTKDPEQQIAKGEIADGDLEDVAPPELLTRILSTKRRHESQGDTAFRIWLFNYIKSLGAKPEIKDHGCILVELDPKSTVLFSCHTDTVHSKAESDKNEKQQLAFDPIFQHIYLLDKASSSCLGGDDGVGIFILLEMIKAKKPGKYIFHTGEEVGGLGAKAFTRNNKKYLDDLNQVVAFDRPVYVDSNPEVIIRQGGALCASKEYGEALAAELSKFNFERDYQVSEKGIYTDSKEYAFGVPECVNLGCFYNKQHTVNEYVDVGGVMTLLDAALKIDWEKLPVKRVLPTEQQQSFGSYMGYEPDEYQGYGGSGGYRGDKSKPASPFPAANKPPAQPPQQTQKITQLKKPKGMMETLDAFDREDFYDFVLTETETASTVLMALHAKVRGLELEVRLLRKLADM